MSEVNNGKKPIYKKWWFITGAAIIIIAAIAGGGKSGSSKDDKGSLKIEYFTDKDVEISGSTEDVISECFDVSLGIPKDNLIGKIVKVNGEIGSMGLINYNPIFNDTTKIDNDLLYEFTIEKFIGSARYARVHCEFNKQLNDTIFRNPKIYRLNVGDRVEVIGKITEIKKNEVKVPDYIKKMSGYDKSTYLEVTLENCNLVHK